MGVEKYMQNKIWLPDLWRLLSKNGVDIKCKVFLIPAMPLDLRKVEGPQVHPHYRSFEKSPFVLPKIWIFKSRNRTTRWYCQSSQCSRWFQSCMSRTQFGEGDDETDPFIDRSGRVAWGISRQRLSRIPVRGRGALWNEVGTLRKIYSITTPNCAISINTRTENWIDTWMQALRITALAPKHQSVVRTTYLWMKKLITTNAIMPVPTSETFGHYCLSR